MNPSNTFLDGKAAVAHLAFAFAGLCVLFSGKCFAIDPHRAMSQYVRDHWGVEQGLPRGSVYAITQTADGYLWIGTDAGLVRFDGLHFLIVPDPAHFLTFRSVVGLVPDRTGNLWVRLSDRTLLRYREGRIENPFAIPEPLFGVTAMSLTRNGELLAAKMQQGAFTNRDGAFVLLAPAEGVPRSPVLSMAQTGDNSVWIGMRGSGLFHLTGGKTIPVSEGLPDPKVNCLLPDGRTSLWIGTDAGVALWNGSAIETNPFPAVPGKLQILALVKDRDANLWVGTDSGGVLRINSGGVMPLDKESSDPRVAVTALFEDRERSLWIGSANGVERLRDSPFVTYSVPEGLPTDGSNPVFVDAQSRLWFPPTGGGIWWTKEGRHGNVDQAALNRDVVYSISGGADELWLGRQRGGLTRVDLKDPAFASRSYTKADGLAQDSVYSVYRSRSGVVWAGTLSGGVSRFDDGKFTTFTHDDGLASNTVASILEGTDQTMWFATPTGLSSLAGNRWRTFRTADGLPSENINCLLEDSSHIIWAGTTAGLAFLGPHHFQALARVPPALTEQILGIAEDNSGWLWVTTSHHVLRARREKLIQGALADTDFVEFGLADGLRGLEGVKRAQSVIKDSLGRIWVSLNGGISVVDPTRLATNESAPAIPHVQSVTADGAPIAMAGSIRIPPGRQRIVFGYSGLNLALPERVRFRYRLENFDHGFSQPVFDRQATYTNLPPGSYRFHLLASNSDGVWSSESVLPFEVIPAFWQAWWFQTCVGFVFIVGFVLLYRFRLNQLTHHLNIRFNERLSERTRIAQELHDTLLQGFLSASMQIHVATDRLPMDSQVKPAFKQALDLMRQVIEEGRNAVRGLRSTQSASMDLEEAFSQIPDEFIAEDLHAETIDFRVVVEGERRPLHPIIRDEVYRIGREALLNAFRHSKGKTIEIELNYLSSVLRMLIRDNGCGIEPQILSSGRHGHWGLSGMRERADRIGARLRLWSSAAGGTEVELTIPGHIAFHQTDEAAVVRSRRKSDSVEEKTR